ncbi:hypothetical protein NDU88_005140 [Pleurodeles waltl]|uniref:Uncharacterized protein n=1 Tax=Pleurodeles waltl TaxID=8319 RepID=A0AAV7PG22_PLEWA|nr:hypothetical protein NDU88_005140 [Pleurodeles waltl]
MQYAPIEKLYKVTEEISEVVMADRLVLVSIRRRQTKDVMVNRMRSHRENHWCGSALHYTEEAGSRLVQDENEVNKGTGLDRLR